MLANKKSGFAKQIRTIFRTIFIFYPIINENFSQNLQYFTYLCDITITLIKRFRFLQNNFLIVFPITNLSG